MVELASDGYVIASAEGYVEIIPIGGSVAKIGGSQR